MGCPQKHGGSLVRRRASWGRRGDAQLRQLGCGDSSEAWAHPFSSGNGEEEAVRGRLHSWVLWVTERD